MDARRRTLATSSHAHALRRTVMAYHEQALVISREIGDRRGEGSDLGNLGIAYERLGDIPQAIAYYEQALELARAIGDRQGEANDCWNLGTLYEQQGDLAQAAQLMQVAAEFYTAIGHAQYAQMCSDGLARVRGEVSGVRCRVLGGRERRPRRGGRCAGGGCAGGRAAGVG
ncbi:tetratricopeptide repeat protein [bacterium]|nr:tetratricopeptide repeat protein [bacterium]